MNPEQIKQTLKAFNVPQIEKITNKHVGRNELCPCGSGKKFKRCHLRITKS